MTSPLNIENSAPISMRTVPINVDHISHANRTPDSVEQDRMVPAPLISGREGGLIESSKDEVGSSPSRHFASVD